MRQRWSFFAKRSKRQSRHGRTAGLLLTAGLIVLGTMSGASAAPAAPTIYAPVTGEAVNDSPVTVAGTASGDAVLIEVYDFGVPVGTTGVSGGYWSIGLWLADGPHSVKAVARDTGFNWGPFSPTVTFTVDTVNPPAPTITAPFDGQIVPFSTITVEGTAEPDSDVTVQVSTGAVLHAHTDGGGSWDVTHTFADTRHTLTARATDAAGNVSLPSASVTFRVDTIVPSPPIIYTPGQGELTNDAPVTVSGSAEPGSTVKVFEGVTIIMEVVAGDGTWSEQRFFSEGVHSITARAFDLAGHASPPSPARTFTVDFTPPAAPVILSPRDGDILKQHYTVTGTAEPHATVQLLKTDKVFASTTADADGNWSVEQSAFSGEQLLKARARDRAGNTGPESPTITFIVDASPPPPPVVETESGTIFLPTQTPRIEGTASDDIGVLTVRLEYSNLAGVLYATRDASCLECPDHEVEWHSDYAPLTGYYVVRVYVIDQAGNRSLPSQLSIIRL